MTKYPSDKHKYCVYIHSPLFKQEKEKSKLINKLLDKYYLTLKK